MPYYYFSLLLENKWDLDLINTSTNFFKCNIASLKKYTKTLNSSNSKLMFLNHYKFLNIYLYTKRHSKHKTTYKNNIVYLSLVCNNSHFSKSLNIK